MANRLVAPAQSPPDDKVSAGFSGEELSISLLAGLVLALVAWQTTRKLLGEWGRPTPQGMPSFFEAESVLSHYPTPLFMSPFPPFSRALSYSLPTPLFFCCWGRLVILTPLETYVVLLTVTAPCMVLACSWDVG